MNIKQTEQHDRKLSDSELEMYSVKSTDLQESVENVEERDVESEDENDYEAKENNEGVNGTTRTVTLQTLMSANVLQPGRSLMTIDYLGQKFVGDLMPDGKIKSQETETVFLTPSAWAVHCKRIINPEKKSGCGWASVKYKGKKLDAYKNSWLRKCALQKESSVDDLDSEADKKADFLLPLIKRTLCPYNTVINRNFSHDGNMLIKAVPFTSMGKVQPFLVTFNSSALLLADFHCHLTMREVCGYFGGHWDINTHTLTINKAYPCRNARYDPQKVAEEERDIKNAIMQDQLLLVGWYHSHPKFQAEPSLRDCDAQLDFQIRMRGLSDVTYTPCVSTIISSYYDENPTLESVVKSIWIMPPNETKQIAEYGCPMLMQYSVLMDKEIPEYVRCEVQACAEYYALFKNEFVKFNSLFSEDVTFLEKLKNTLRSKIPIKQDYTTLWSWICEVLGCAQKEEFIPSKTIPTIDVNKGETTDTTISMPYSVNSPQDEKTKDDYITRIVELEKNDFDKKVSEIKVMTLQEQLCLPSGLNMNPVRTYAPLTTPNLLGVGNRSSLPTQNTPSSSCHTPISSENTTICSGLLSPLPTVVTAGNNTTATKSTVSATEIYDSPITVPSSPAKSEIPIKSSSPPKSETPLYTLHLLNSPVQSPRSNSNITQNISNNNKYETPNISQTQSAIFPSTTNDLVAASLAQLTGQLVPNFLQNDLANLFQQHQSDKNYGNYTLNQIASGNGEEQKNSLSETAASRCSKNFNLPRIQELLVHNQEMLINTKNKTDPSKISSNLNFSSISSNFHKTKLMKELSNIKNDPSKINKLMRSPEYAALLLHQAEALGATTLSTLGIGSDLNFLTGSSIGTKANASQIADYNNLVQVSKTLGYESCMQLAKSDDLNNFLQQQIGAVAAATLANVSLSSSHNASKKQKQPESKPLTDYSSILETYSKLFEPESSFRGGEIIGNTANNARRELSALFSSDTELSVFDTKPKSKDATLQIQEKQNANKNQFENLLFCHQSKISPDLGTLYATSTATTNKPETPQDYLYLQQQHEKHDSNFFISPAAMMKIQTDSLSAMMMKPPKTTSSTISSLSRTRETSTSPALRCLTPTKSGAGSSNACNTTNLKYNFSATDLAVSSIQSNTSASVPVEAGNNLIKHRRLSNTPPVDLSCLYGEGQSPLGKGYMKKRMEFSSIAELAAPPPTKMSKVNEDTLSVLQ
ncbi:MPN domain-containing protein CG4751 [Anastrepha ludens]|uniref:MPN domain-containing protein CG4751 n=1 Tax=Anastrepha ludens TaxID=28586 RepID=UPI0023B11022|nr:MPN domain-containing protein CG4751 [Anastrepha ludens]